MSFDQFLGFGSDPCAVLDRNGVIAAVNDVWMVRASAAGAAVTAGIGADYLDVCRRAAAAGAPQSELALTTVEELTRGGAGSRSFLYPCTMPTGARWFRADVTPVDPTGHVGIRHVDVTQGHSRLDTDVIDTDAVLFSAAGLRLAVADALDGPPHPAVLVAVTDLPAHDDPASGLAVSAAAARETRVGSVARINDHTLALMVTAPDQSAARATCDTVVQTVAQRTGWEVHRWAVAVATVDDDADSVIARARRSLLRGLDGTQEDHARERRSARLQHAAAMLTNALAEFDRALDRGSDIYHLRELDHRVELAERACTDAATDAPPSFPTV